MADTVTPLVGVTVGPDGTATLSLDHLTELTGRTWAESNGRDRTILDDTGRSAFPTVAGGDSDTRIAFGALLLAWNANRQSPSVVVPHGLGLTPQAVVFGEAEAFGYFGANWQAYLDAVDGTNISVHGLADAPVTMNKFIFWMAIGHP